MGKSGLRGNGGFVIQELENRRFLSVTTVVIGFGGSTGIRFLAENGDNASFTVSHATASITFSGPLTPVTNANYTSFPLSAAEEVESIVITDAVPNAAVLSVHAYSSDPLFTIGSITGGNLLAINGLEASLTGSLNVASVHRVVLGAVAGAAMNFGSHLDSLQVKYGFTGALTVGTLGTFTTPEMLDSSINATAPFSRSSLDIGLIKVAKSIQGSQITAAGNIGTVRANLLQDSIITAATVAPAALPGAVPAILVPEASTAFSQAAVIHSVAIIGRGALFNNSIVAADIIGSVQMTQLGAGGGGVAAHTIGALSTLAPPGSLDLVSLRLGYGAMRTSAKLAATLSARDIAFQSGILGIDNVLVFGLDLNVLR